jgi:hypothetical protein
MLNLNSWMFSLMMFMSQHLIISFLIYRMLITISNKSLTKLDLFFRWTHFHIKHMVSEILIFTIYSSSHNCCLFFSDLLHNYPCSIVALSLMYNITSNAFIIEQIKSFAQHKKDPSHYLVSRLLLFYLSSSLICFYRVNYYIV